MECHACGRSVGADDRFCNGCGSAVLGAADATSSETPVESAATGTAAANETESNPVTATTDLPKTELIETEPASAESVDVWDADPVWAPTAEGPEQSVAAVVATSTSDLPATEPITEVWMDGIADQPSSATPYDFAERETVAITGQVEAQPTVTATMPIVRTAAPEPAHKFGFNLILLIGIITGIVSLVAMFANVVKITSDSRLVFTEDTPPDFRTGTWLVDDLAGNLSIAGLVAILAMVAGGIAAGFRWRWGSGLAGGAGLAMAGLSMLILGMAQFPIDSAKAFARVPSDDPFVLTITRDFGYWTLLVAGALGIVLFFASVNDAFGDRRAGLNPWIAALGALAVVVMAAGPLIPENQAVFSDNWYLVDGVGEPSALLLVGRLLQLGLLLIGGVIGFLSVQRWGLGVAAGAALPGGWLVISTLFELTDDPVGLGYQNPGAADMHVHGVTIIGTSAVLAMLVLGAISAYDQSARERR